MTSMWTLCAQLPDDGIETKPELRPHTAQLLLLSATARARTQKSKSTAFKIISQLSAACHPRNEYSLSLLIIWMHICEGLNVHKNSPNFVRASGLVKMLSYAIIKKIPQNIA